MIYKLLVSSNKTGKELMKKTELDDKITKCHALQTITATHDYIFRTKYWHAGYDYRIIHGDNRIHYL